MRILTAVMTVLIVVVFIGSTMAVPTGKTVEYPGGAQGKVTFDGKTHAEKGLTCMDCHTKIFQMKKEAKMTMADHKANKFCFACHNGTKAFKAGDAANCIKCHKK